MTILTDLFQLLIIEFSNYIKVLKPAMIETIYIYNGKYPFNNECIPSSTFLQVSQEYDCEYAIQKARENCITFKKLDSMHLVKLKRILKEDKVLHLIYEYFSISLQDYVKKIQDEEELSRLIASLALLVQTLVKAGIKTDLSLDSMTVDQTNEFKVFVHPSYDLVEDRLYLVEYYEAEEKRLQIQIEEIYEAAEGAVKHKEKAQIKTPNFVINGNTLIFGKEAEQNKSLSLKSKQSIQMSKPEQESLNLQKKQSQRDSLPLSPSITSKQQMTIKRSKELLAKAKFQIYRQPRQSNPDHSGTYEDEQCNMKEKRERTQPNQTDLSQDQRGNTSTEGYMNSSQQGQGQNPSRKLKMRITTCHEIEVEAADLDKIKNQILQMGDTNILPPSLVHGIKATEITSYPSDPVPSYLISISEKVRLAKQKAENALNGIQRRKNE